MTADPMDTFVNGVCDGCGRRLVRGDGWQNSGTEFTDDWHLDDAASHAANEPVQCGPVREAEPEGEVWVDGLKDVQCVLCDRITVCRVIDGDYRCKPCWLGLEDLLDEEPVF